MNKDLQRQRAIAEAVADIHRKNQWGIVVLWRGMSKEIIDIQVEEVVQANHEMRIAI